MRHNLDISASDPLEYKMGISILVQTICMGKSIRMKMVNKKTISFPILNLDIIYKPCDILLSEFQGLWF